MTLVKYNLRSLKEYPRRILDLDSMTDDAEEFSFDDDCVYEIKP